MVVKKKIIKSKKINHTTTSSKKERVRAHILYSGRVQGVGFRHTCEYLAIDRKISGYVKNLTDGRVEMICEGSRKDIETYLLCIQNSQIGPYIQKRTIDWQSPKGERGDMRIEYIL